MENVEIAKWVPVPSGITSTSEDYRAQNVIDEFFQPRKKQATVWSSGFGSAVGYYLYLMENVLDDESQKKVLQALEEADVFTSGGLMKENGRSSIVRQLEPQWHIETTTENPISFSYNGIEKDGTSSWRVHDLQMGLMGTAKQPTNDSIKNHNPQKTT
ncbi:hypothetical protein SAY86_017137 [Trapa natans]|uniref:Uncharacterized protein n=1 Tax=Trapa natans TaxID=22666 RepID=A0AAN7M0Z5_TRANT|nr:hypothetical protein SAY86_017137 [Trapa natans]